MHSATWFSVMILMFQQRGVVNIAISSSHSRDRSSSSALSALCPRAESAHGKSRLLKDFFFGSLKLLRLLLHATAPDTCWRR